MGTTLMKFQFGSYSLEFEAGADYPASRPVQLYQIKDRTASGILQIETLGITIKKRALNFSAMPLVDYENLLDWFINIVNGGEYEFEFTDERGFTGNVRITDDIIDFQEVSFENYAGVLNLEYTQ